VIQGAKINTRFRHLFSATRTTLASRASFTARRGRARFLYLERKSGRCAACPRGISRSSQQRHRALLISSQSHPLLQGIPFFRAHRETTTRHDQPSASHPPPLEQALPSSRAHHVEQRPRAKAGAEEGPGAGHRGRR
jgi:hypothetical protein